MWVAAAAVVAVASTAAVAAPAPPTGVPGGAPPILWSGRAWTPRVSVGKEDPGTGYWLGVPDDVSVDALGRLHLKVAYVGGQWRSSEIDSVESDFGYGTYRWVVDTPLASFDPAVVAGMFTYNRLQTGYPKKSDREVGHLENDIEMARWHNLRDPNNAQFVVQPYWARGHLRRVRLPSKASPLTYEFTWAPSGTLFDVRLGAGGTGRVVARWFTRNTVGAPRTLTQVAVNFWYDKVPPSSGATQELVVRSFDYVPAA